VKFAITRRQQRTLFAVSASCYACWLAGFGDRLEAQGVVRDDLTIAARATAAPPVTRSIVRDPFAGAPDGEATSTNASGEDPLLRPLSNRTRPDAPLVPDIDTSGDALAELPARTTREPAGAAPQFILRATLVGTPSLAYVTGPDGTAIERVGDRVGERRIQRIDLRGISFTDGTRLWLVDRRRELRAPSATGTKSGLAEKIDALRAVVSKLAQPALLPAAAPATPTAQPSVEAVVTPGPLPTIIPNALPVGVSPTANAYGPTPFPVPEIHSYPHPG
jgi:hypothetical protein